MQRQRIRNMEEFSTLCGVSRPTVSKYFQDPTSVRATTRQRIEDALNRFDYRPNIYAINQNRDLTKSVGIVVPHLTDPVFGQFIQIIERQIVDAGFSPAVLSAHGERASEANILNSLRALKPAGVLLAPLGNSSDHAALEEFCEEVPTVLFDSYVGGLGHAFIGSNNHQSVGLIVEYLAQTGEPPSFFEMTSPINPNAIERRYAYQSAMERLGHKPHFVQAKGDNWDFEGIAFAEGGRALDRNAFATRTVLCSNDRLAIGLLSAAHERGLRVGPTADCALRIAGHDDHPFSRYTWPPLTTVSQDYAAIAGRSVEMLLHLIASGDTPSSRETTYFDGRLVIRGSA